jgi:hypothetical protein
VSNEVPTPSNARPRRVQTAISIVFTILACCVAPLTLLAWPFINLSSPYPNSTPAQGCSSSAPYANYDPRNSRLVIGFHKYACVSTTDQLNTVIGWYGRQGRRLPPELPSSHLVRTYKFNIASLMVFDDLSLQTASGGTSIIWSADYMFALDLP